MRELKFRAWDKEDKKYLLPENQEFVILPTRPSFGVTIPFQSESYPNENLDIDCVDWADADLIMGRYELEQYTGLKDKNGKEIYEGDIVRCYSRKKSLGEYQVIWNEDCAGFECESLKPLVDGGDSMLTDVRVFNEMFIQFRVIGNIHENPELLD